MRRCWTSPGGTHEILSTTRGLRAHIAPGQAPSRAIRHGPVPRELTTHRDQLTHVLMAELRAQAAAHPGDLLAVICADRRVAALPTAGIDLWARIMPVSQARGLGFDHVVLIDPSEIATAHQAVTATCTSPSPGPPNGSARSPPSRRVSPPAPACW